MTKGSLRRSEGLDYLLRPTVIADDQLKDDYCVFQLVVLSGG